MPKRAMEVRIEDRGLSVLFIRVKGAPDEIQSRVGVHGDSELALIASVHEMGSLDGHTPKRSYLRRTAELFRTKYEKIAQKAYANFLDGEWTLEQAMTAVGVEAVSDVKRSILKGIPPKLQPATVRSKQRRGLPRPKTPLYGAGKLFEAIRQLVITKDKG